MLEQSVQNRWFVDKNGLVDKPLSTVRPHLQGAASSARSRFVATNLRKQGLAFCSSFSMRVRFLRKKVTEDCKRAVCVSKALIQIYVSVRIFSHPTKAERHGVFELRPFGCSSSRGAGRELRKHLLVMKNSIRRSWGGALSVSACWAASLCNLQWPFHTMASNRRLSQSLISPDLTSFTVTAPPSDVKSWLAQWKTVYARGDSHCLSKSTNPHFLIDRYNWLSRRCCGRSYQCRGCLRDSPVREHIVPSYQVWRTFPLWAIRCKCQSHSDRTQLIFCQPSFSSSPM